MGMPISKSAPLVKVRLWRLRSMFYVLARLGQCWLSIRFIEKYHTDKRAKWSTDVKIKGGWCCRKCGEGLYDHSLLESHHTVPVHKRPDLQLELDNGECLCLWGHALKHKDDPVLMNMILLRLVRKLTERHCKPFSKCQMELLGLSNG